MADLLLLIPVSETDFLPTSQWFARTCLTQKAQRPPGTTQSSTLIDFLPRSTVDSTTTITVIATTSFTRIPLPSFALPRPPLRLDLITANTNTSTSGVLSCIFAFGTFTFDAFFAASPDITLEATTTTSMSVKRNTNHSGIASSKLIYAQSFSHHH
ncbi:unnamed protein product [Taenia asiatica]|uniref:Uncharacterized protein n=1 Tax=Taenia asiatica TaxID=60517 RepID=A0A0R3VZH7_TAEAS|nr:unnamed protein product [Taenia asiatica]